MEQKQKNKILKFLPRAVSAVNFQSHQPFSPSKDPHKRSTGNNTYNYKLRGFSGPIVSIIPDEVRRKYKNRNEEPGAEEPTSPKVSCMGQIKHKKEKIKKKAAAKVPKKSAQEKTKGPVASDKEKVGTKKGPSGGFGRLFKRTNSDASNSTISSDKKQPAAFVSDKAVPSLGQMKRFASGRENFKNFDWTAQIEPLESDVQGKGYYSDEDHGVESEPEDEEKEVIIPFSAPITFGGGGKTELKPRTEVNLWKRRTMNPPRPLQLD